MGDSGPRFEIADTAGTTLQKSDTVGTSAIDFPVAAGNAVSEFLVQCPTDQLDSNLLKVSLDGGTNVMTLSPGGHWAWTPKGSTITQINLVGNVAGVKFEIVANFEED